MGTVIDRVDLAHSRWLDRHSALHLAVTAADDCLQRAGCKPDDLDLIVMRGYTATATWGSRRWPL